MSNGDAHQVALLCEAEGYPDQGSSCRAVVEIRPGGVERDHVGTQVSLTLADQTFSTWRTLYGINFLHFADDLDRIRTRLEGSARLFDWDGETVLCLTVISRLQGRLAVGGQLVPAIFWTETRSEDQFLAPPLYGHAGGIRVSFEGLVTDQSYLPPVINGIRRFLAESGISTRSPME